MATNLQWSKNIFNDPNLLGFWPNPSETDAMRSQRFPLFEGTNADVIFSYTVPNGKIENLKNIIISPISSSAYYRTASSPLRAGTCIFLVDGTTKLEFSLNPLPLNAANTSWCTNWRSHCAMTVNLGEGIDFNESQVIELQTTALNHATGVVNPEKWIARMHGKNSSTNAPMMYTGNLRSPDTGIATDILSVTVPVNGFRLLSMDIDIFVADPSICTIQVFVNGCLIAEMPYLTIDMEKCQFGGAPYYGTFDILGGWGMLLNPGDRVEVLGHALLDFGQAVGFQMASNTINQIGQQPIYAIGV